MDPKKYILSGFLQDKMDLKKIKKHATNNINYRCCIMEQGQIIGEEDAIKLRKYSKTVTCKTQEGELLVMNIQDFYQRVKPNEESWAKICENSVIKQDYLQKTFKNKL